MAFAKFMASQAGRLLRIVAGVVLIGLGLFATQPPTAIGYIAAVVGVVFVLVGAFNVCLLAPLMGLPLSGKAVLSK